MWKRPVRCALFIWSVVFVALPADAGQSVTLAWDPSPVPDVVGYNLYYGLASGNYAAAIHVSAPSTEVTVPNLVGNQLYFFAVTAVTSSGFESGYSDEVSTALPNSAPIAMNASVQALEGQPRAIALAGLDDDGDPLSFAITSPPSHGSLSGTPPNLIYSPDENFYGFDSFSFVVTDGRDSSEPAVISITASNNQPTLDRLPNLVVSDDSGPIVVNLSGISSGSDYEAQHLVVSAVSNNPRLIPNPTVSYTSPNGTGTLTFTPINNTSEFPMARITVTVSDGQLGHPTRSRSFFVLVIHANFAPTIDPLADVTLNEDSAPLAVELSGITSGAINEVQPLTVTAVSSNPSLIPDPAITYSNPDNTGQLTLAPLPGVSGTATIIVRVSDGEPERGTTTRSFVATVLPGNRPPVVNAGADRTIERPGTISLAGSVTDDLWPNGSGQWTASWSQVSGPATVTFGDASNVLSSATLSAAGEYTLRLTATDGTAATSDDVRVTVIFGPNVNPPNAFDLSVAAVDARTAIVKLRTDRPAFCAVEYGLTADLGLTAGGFALGTNHSVLLTNLQPATAYFFRVRCSDAANNSSLTYTLSFGVSPIAIVRWAAEVGSLLEPMTIGTDAFALGQQYIWSPDADQGSASYLIEVPVESQYRMWCRVLTLDAVLGSLSLSVDGSAGFTFDTTTAGASAWDWVSIDLATGPLGAQMPGEGRLPRGPHEFVFHARQPGIFLDELVLSNDPEWRP